MDEQQHREREHFFGSAKVITGMTILSRIAGLVRAMAIAAFGANALTDAFTFAWQVPNLLRRLFAEGAMTAAFVPTFTKLLEDKENGLKKASALLANAMGLLALLLAGIYAVTQLGLLVWLWASPPASASVDASNRHLLILLTSLMLPFMITICLLALASAALNCRGHFAYPAATPIILNLVIIAVAYAVRYTMSDAVRQLEIIALGVSFAGIVQFAGVFWLLRKHGFALRWKLRPIEPGIRQMARLMAPALLGLGFLQISELLQTGLAWMLRYSADNPTLSVFGWQLTRPLQDGVLPQISNARYLYQFPMGVLAISLGVAVFPLLSRYAARGDMPNFRDSVNRALRLSFMEGMATGVGLLILAEPITRLLFRTGKYTLDDVHVTAVITQMYVLGMWAYCTYQIIVRAFYSLNDTTTPLKVSCVLAVVNLLLIGGLIWVPDLGPGAFGVSTSATFAINTLVLAMLLRRRVGLLGGRKMARSFARTLVACAIMAAVLLALLVELNPSPTQLWPGFSPGPHLGISFPADWSARLISFGIVAVTVPAGAAVFVLSAWLMRAPELGELFGAVKRRINRSVESEPAPQDAQGKE